MTTPHELPYGSTKWEGEWDKLFVQELKDPDENQARLQAEKQERAHTRLMDFFAEELGVGGPAGRGSSSRLRRFGQFMR
jgi:hypothetical protein